MDIDPEPPEPFLAVDPRELKMNITLVGFTRKGARKDIPVQGTSAIIGRTTEADIQIPVSDVSRRHCQIAVTANKVTVKDLGSSNGTFVNNQKIAETTLRPGDRLTVGPFTFVVQINGLPKDIPKLVPKPGPRVVAGPETTTKAAPAPASKPGKAVDDDFDIDDLNIPDLSDVDLDEMSPLEPIEEIGSDELEELDESDLIDEGDDTPKGKK